MRSAIFVVGIGAIAFALSAKLVPATDTPPKFKITSKHDNDRVDVSIEKGTTALAIHSPNGISETTLTRTDAKWPESVVVRMHLKGLEFFQAANGTDSLHISVSSTGAPKRVRVWLNDKENAPLDSKSPYWTELRMIDRDGKPTEAIVLKGGFFEFRLPAAFFAKNPESITLHWIDFYRR